MNIDFILENSPALIIAIPLLAAFITPLISKIGDRARNAFVIAILAFTEFMALWLARDIFRNGLQLYIFGSKLRTPAGYSFPIRIIFEIDAMSAFMGIIVATIALIAAIYSWSFIQRYSGKDKYYTLFLLLIVGIFGMVFTGDLFNFFVFFEIASISSCALVAFFIRGESAEASFKYIVIGSIAGLIILLAVGFLYGEYDALNIGYIAGRINETGISFIDKIALCLFISALAMKAGSVPMHWWKPDAYGEAPQPITMMLVVSSLASLYALFRVCFTLYSAMDTVAMGWILIIFGVVSIFIGATMAIPQTNLTRLIGYVAVAEVGYILLAIGIGLHSGGDGYGFKSMEGGIFHLINDAIDLGLLFLVAGAIFHATGKRDLNEMGGLAHSMRYTSIFFIIGLAAVGGLPPMNGFASKLMIYETSYQLTPILSIFAILTSILMLGVFVKVFYSAFLGPKLYEVREVPLSMLLAMGILVAMIIFFSFFPDLIVQKLANPAVRALLNPENYIRAIGG